MDFEVLLHLLKKRFVKPHIAKRISLEEVGEFHENLENSIPRGMIVCLPWKRSGSINKYNNVAF
jgi:D-arabinose 1-dehydrogenase-like Zn-dependent alcohol dehydrogenase